jgi:hypothetical protein
MSDGDQGSQTLCPKEQISCYNKHPKERVLNLLKEPKKSLPFKNYFVTEYRKEEGCRVQKYSNISGG